MELFPKSTLNPFSEKRINQTTFLPVHGLNKPFNDSLWQRAHDFPRLPVPAQGHNAGIDKPVEVEEADHVAEAPLGERSGFLLLA